MAMAARERLVQGAGADTAFIEEPATRRCCLFWRRGCNSFTGMSAHGGHGHAPSLDHVIHSLRRNLTMLHQLHLPPMADVATAQLNDVVEKLEAVANGASPADVTQPSPAVPSQSTATSTSSASNKQASVHFGSHAVVDVGVEAKKSDASPKAKLGPADMWKFAAQASVIQEHTSMQPGAMAPAMNRIVTILWPRISEYAEAMIKNDIEPSINASLPGMMGGRGVKFTNVTLGHSSPHFGPILVDEGKAGAIQIKMGIKFESDLDVQLTAMGIPIGISRFFLNGNLVILLTPPMNKPPFFGGMQIYFPNPPDLGINFGGAARVADVPGLKGAVRGAIQSAVGDVCVLPRRIAVDMDEEDAVDSLDLTYPDPIGVLRFTLHAGSELLAADTSFIGREGTSDPYVVATLGCKSWQSPTVMKTLNPTWGDNGKGLSFDFPVHDTCQVLSVKVFDYDFGTSDDLIGVAPPLTMELTGSLSDRIDVPLKSESGEGDAGHLIVSHEMLSLSSDSSAARMAGPSVAFLAFKILSVSGLNSKMEYPFKVQVRVVAPSKSTGDAAPQKASFRSMLSRSSTTSFKEKQEVLAEATTAASVPLPQPHLAEALQNICQSLADRGYTSDDIADILSVNTGQVAGFMKAHGDAAEMEKLANEAAKERAATNPSFNEILQVLLPRADPDATVELIILDKKSKTVASVSIPLRRIQEAQNMSLDGPFYTESGPEVIGCLRMKWLC